MFKVLVVEDDKNTNFLLGKLLSKLFGCTVISAFNGAEGLEAIEGENPDVVLMDIHMPVMDGIETLETLRKSEKHSDLPVITITADNERSAVKKMAELGVYDYLLKPLIYAETKVRLRKIFSKIKDDLQKKEQQELSTSDTQELKTLLLVCKDIDLAEKIKDSGKPAFIIHTAENGADGFKLFGEVKPDIVALENGIEILDANMVAKKIKGDAAGESVKIVLLNTGDELAPENKLLFDRGVNLNMEAEKIIDILKKMF